jgi:hypothetical protein
MSQELFTTNVTLPISGGGTVAAGTFIVPAFALPGTSHGGGVYLVRAKYAANAAIAVGSAPIFQIVSLDANSLPIATLGANGSAAMAAGTAIVGTISTNWVAGTVGYVGIKYGHGAFGAATMVYVNASLQYYLGRGSA